MTPTRDVSSRKDHASFLAAPDGQVYPLSVGQRVAANDCVAISANAEPMLVSERNVGHPQRGTDQLELMIEERPGHALGNLLKEGKIESLVY